MIVGGDSANIEGMKHLKYATFDKEKDVEAFNAALKTSVPIPISQLNVIFDPVIVR